MRRIAAVCVTAWTIFCAPDAAAHPHMWIRGRIAPELGRRGLESVRVVWDIDELTSSTLILDYDADRDGRLSPSEVDELRRGAFEHLVEAEYYLVVEVGRLLATPQRARDFDARIVDGRLVYEFVVPLAVTVRWEDLGDVRLFFFDQSYFIDFRPEDIRGTTVRFDGAEVRFDRSRRRSMTMGYGMVELTGLEVAEVVRR